MPIEKVKLPDIFISAGSKMSAMGFKKLETETVEEAAQRMFEFVIKKTGDEIYTITCEQIEEIREE